MAKKPKIKTNEQWVKHIMNWAPTGALSQAFVLQAITKYAEAVAKAPLKELESPWVNAAAWKATAEYIMKEYEANYSF